MANPRFSEIGNPYGELSVHSFGAKGDGVTDDTAAVQAAFAANYSGVYFPRGTYLVTATIRMGATGTCSVFGDGRESVILGRNISGPVVLIEQQGGQNVRGMVSSLTVLGDNVVDCVKVHARSGPLVLESIWVGTSGSGCEHGFYFYDTYGCSFRNLTMDSSTPSHSAFRIGPVFGDNYCENWYTSTASPYNFYFEGTVTEQSGSSVFINLTAQNGDIGFFLGEYFHESIFIKVYTENCVNPIVIGYPDGSANRWPRGNQIIGGVIGPAYESNAGFADQVAMIHLKGAVFTRIAGVRVADHPGQAVTFTGGDGTGAYALARVTMAGAVHSIEVLCGGSGYSEAPTVTVAQGAGATFSVTLDNGTVASIAVTGGGTGYSTLQPPLALLLGHCHGLLVESCGLRSDFDAGGVYGPLYPFVCKDSTAPAEVSVNIVDDWTYFDGATNPARASLHKASGAKHFLQWIDNAGAVKTKEYALPVYP